MQRHGSQDLPTAATTRAAADTRCITALKTKVSLIRFNIYHINVMLKMFIELQFIQTSRPPHGTVYPTKYRALSHSKYV